MNKSPVSWFKGMQMISFAFALAGCSTLESWVSEGFSRRSFQVRPTWVIQATQQENMTFRKINRFKPLFFETSARKNIVIQASGVDGLAAYERNSGQLAWRLPIQNGVEGSAAISSGILYFGAGDGQFYSVSAETGKVLWTFPTRIENLSEPLVEDGVVYFLTGANSVYALDAKTGKQSWLYTRADSQTISIRGGSRPTLRGDTLYVGFSDGAMVALVAKNGQIKWEKQLSKNKRFRDLDSDPLLDRDVIYILGYDDAAYALRAATGDLVWRLEKGGYGGFLLSGEKLFYSTSSGEVLCVDRSTGRQMWSYKISDGIGTTPNLYKGLVVFGESQGAVRFLDATTGKEIQHFFSGRGVLSPVSVDEKNNLLYFISNEANLWALEAKWDKPNAFEFLR